MIGPFLSGLSKIRHPLYIIIIYWFLFIFLGSFTELYINSLLHLVDHIDDMDEKHMKFLPDLQITETSCNQKDLGKKNIWFYITILK